MADFLDTLMNFSPANLVVRPQADQEQINTIVNSPAAMQATAISIDRGNEVTNQNAILQDSKTLTAAEFLGKYGPDIANQITTIEAGGRGLPNLELSTRTPAQQLADDAISVGSGVIQTVGGISTLGAGIINQDAGIIASEALGGIKDFTDNLQSVDVQNARTLDALRADIDRQSNDILYNKDIENGSTEFEAGLASFGRDVLGGVNRLLENPMTLETGLAEGVGSLLVGGPVSKGVGLAGMTVGKALGLNVAARAAEWGSASLMPASIALMEGGNAYSGAVQEVMEMTPEDLSANSPQYLSLVQSGMSPDEARKTVANRAGMISAAIQAPLAGLTAKVADIGAFEAAPLATKSFGGMVRDILKETTEEGIQSLSGEIAQNAGIKLTADETRSIIENAGSSMIQGAIMGAGTAGIVQAPRIPDTAIRAGLDALNNRGSAINTRNAAASGVTPEDITANAAAATTAMPVVVEAAQKLAETVPADIKEAVGADTFGRRFEKALGVDETTLRSLGPDVLRYFGENGAPQFDNKLQLVMQTALLANNQDADPTTRSAAGLFLLKSIAEQEQLFSEDAQQVFNDVDQESTEYKVLGNYIKTLKDIQTLPAVVEAMKWAQNDNNLVFDEAPTEQQVQNVVTAASTKPDLLSPETVSKALLQSDQGNITLTPEQRKVLKNVEAVQRVAAQASQQIVVQTGLIDNLTENAKEVSRQLFTKKDGAEWQLPLTQHVARINSAIADGDVTGGSRALKHLANLVASQRNKARAAIQSYRTGQMKVPFQAIGAYGKPDPTPHTWGGTHKGNVNSENLARRVFLEANALGEAYNALVQQNPEFASRGLVQTLKLPEDLFGKQGATETAQQAEPKEETSNPAPEVQTPVRELSEAISEQVQEQPSQPATTTVEEVAETAVEPTAEVNGAIQAPAEADIETTFSKLMKPEGLKNKIISAFNLPKKAHELLNWDNPLRRFQEILPDFDTNSIEFDLDESNIEALQNYVDAGLDMIYNEQGTEPTSLVKRMRDYLNSPYSKSDPTTMREMFKKGKDLAEYRHGRMFALMERSGNGVRYNPYLIQSAMMATLDWFASRQNREVKLDAEDIAKSLGVDVSEVGKGLIEQFNEGVGLTQATRSLAENITKFWGLTGNKDVSETYVKGIPEAVAKEMLHVLEANGWMTSSEIKLPDKRTFIQFHFGNNITDNVHDMLYNMGPARKLIEMAAISPEDRGGATYGKTSTRKALTQVRNKVVPTTKTQRMANNAAQSIRFNFNRNGYDMQRALGLENMIRLDGSMVIGAKTKLNKVHKKSVEGRNRTIENALNELESQFIEAEAYASKAGQTIDEIDKFYETGHNRVGRLQFLGIVTPQSDQRARHVWMPTKSVVDMTDTTSEGYTGFWMAATQGMDEIKTHLHTPEENRDWAIANMTNPAGKFFPLVQMLQDWLQDNKRGDLTAFTDAALAISPKGMSNHAMLSLLSVAEYMNARETGNLKEFTSFNYFEADGITNGATNALMNLFRASSKGIVDTVAKAGVFIGKTNTVMSSMRGQKDLYETSSTFATQFAAETKKSLTDDVRPLHTALFNVTSALGLSIGLDAEGNVVVARKGIKNPFTITMYQSGIDGIAGNVTNDLLDALYQKMSEYVNSDDESAFGDNFTKNGEVYSAEEFWADVNLLLNKKAARRVSPKGDMEWLLINRKGDQRSDLLLSDEALLNFEVNGDEFTNLQDNIRVLLVEDMVKGIGSTVMDYIKEPLEKIQKITNAQSIVMHHMFRKRVLQAMADRKINPEKYPDYRAGDFLTQNELDSIFKSLMPYGATFRTEGQNFFIGTGERNEILSTKEIDPVTGREKTSYTMEINVDGKPYTVTMPRFFSESTTKDYATGAYAFAPAYAGVSGVPTWTIGTGDGRMIDLFLSRPTRDKVKQALVVYDGINFGVNDIIKGSEQANAAAYDAWTENPLRAIQESFEAFLRLAPLDELFDTSDPYNFEAETVALALTRNVSGTKKVPATMGSSDIQTYFEKWLSDITEDADAIDDRIHVMKRMPLSADQMAGRSAPYTQKGSIAVPESATSAEIEDIMELEAAKRAIARTKEKKQVTAIATPTEELVKALKEQGKPDSVTGAVITDIAGLETVRKAVSNRLPNAHREMLAATLNELAGSGYKIVMGSADQLSRYEQNNHPDTYMPDVSYYGKIDIENEVIYLNNPSSETLVHELIHAATIMKMRAYYGKSKSLSQTDAEAVKRLEGIMGEWLTQVYDLDTSVIQEAHRAATTAILGHQNAGRPAEALNEFLAWSLSNQQLINLQKKTQVKNPLFILMGQALTALKQLIWGHKKAPAIGTDMFAQVRFNARLLMATPTPLEVLMQDMSVVALFQSNGFGNNPRIAILREKFEAKIKEFTDEKTSSDIKINQAEYAKRHNEAHEAMIRADQVAMEMQVPFNLDMQAKSTLQMISAAFAVSNNLNTNSVDRLQDIFDGIVSQINPTDFMVNPDADPTSTEYSADFAQAQEKFNAITGVSISQTDRKGRTSLLPTFVAMAMVSEDVRNVLHNKKLPKRAKIKNVSVDTMLDRFGEMLMDGINTVASGDINKGNLVASMDALVKNLLDNVGDQRSFIEQYVNNGLDTADNIIKSYIEKAADKAEKFAETLNGPVSAKVGKAIKMVVQATTADGAKALADGAISFMNQEEMSVTAREALNEVIGRTDDNAPVFDQISKTRTFIDQTRQQWRDNFPKELRKKFSRTLTEGEWADLFRGMGKTDTAALLDTYKADKALELLSSGSARATEVAKLVAKLSTHKNWKAMDAKAKQLANYMVTGDHGIELQRNAYAIGVINGNADTDTVNNLDSLVSLYALENLSEITQNTLTNLIENEKVGIENLYGFLRGIRNIENTKSATNIGRMNGYKGHIKADTQEGVHLTIAPKGQHGSLTGMGYVFLGDYQGSSADQNMGSMGYYFTPVSGRAKFNQGVMRTVRQTQFGVDPDTGFTVNEALAGRITNPQIVASIAQRTARSGTTTENLLPIFNDKGRVIAYERAADPAKLAKLNPTEDLAQALGTWRGRQSEEEAAQHVNDMLVDDLFSIWSKGKQGGQKNEFVRVDQSTDAIISDAWNNIPAETKVKIKAKFGDDGFRVRKDMVNDAIGARSATVGDFWTGTSRWKPGVQAEIRQAVLGIFGNKGYHALVNAENFVQGFVTDAKVLIVIKSVIVPAANLVSNIYQLSMNGVPIRSILSGMKGKTAELNSYINRRSMEMRLQNDLLVAEAREDSVEVRKLTARIRTLQDSYKRMSIWPLIENGEFGAITEGGVTQEDLALANGGWAGLIDRLANKLPNGLKDPVRYALVTRDTSLFKALSRATQYGDFIAKAILYDDLTKRKKMTQKETLAFINEEFINYNRFAGRQRSYLESMGLLWFYNFKLRSMKIAQRMIHNHPFRALMHMAMTPRVPGLGLVGSVLTDNFLAIGLEGNLGNSIGPGQLFRAPSLNPWASIID